MPEPRVTSWQDSGDILSQGSTIQLGTTPPKDTQIDTKTTKKRT